MASNSQFVGSSSVANVLADAMRGRRLSEFEQQLIDVLHHDIYRRVDDLRTSEACLLAYARLRYLRARVDISLSNLMSDLDRLLALHQWVGLVDGAMMTILTIHFNLCIGSIVQHGAGRPELQPLLDELDCMDSFGVFLASELAYGNNVQALETEAVYDHDAREFLIHTPRAEAQKFMPNTGAEGIGKLGVVMARLNVQGVSRGIFPFVVRIRTSSGTCAGVHVHPLGDKPDYPLDNAITFFDRVRVPFHQWLSGSESRIDADGTFSSAITSASRRFFTSMDRVQVGKLCIATGALSVMRGSVDLTLRYARQRRTFGVGHRDVSLLQYRTYQQAVFEGVGIAYAGSFLLQRVRSECRARTPDNVVLNRLLAIGKIYTSSQGIQVMLRCRERVGAQGMFSANRIISYWVQTNGVVTAEGDNEILLVRMARELIGGKGYEPPPPLAAENAITLESAGALLSLLGEREWRLLEQLRSSLSRGARKGTLFEVWNAHVSDAVELASLHVQRVALETFAQRVESIEDNAARDVLSRLLRLCALQELAKNAGSLLVEGAIEAGLVRGIAGERARLAASLLPDVPELIAGFDIPHSLVDAPIAVDYVAAFNRMSAGVTGEPAPARSTFIRELEPGAGRETKPVSALAADGSKLTLGPT